MFILLQQPVSVVFPGCQLRPENAELLLILRKGGLLLSELRNRFLPCRLRELPLSICLFFQAFQQLYFLFEQRLSVLLLPVLLLNRLLFRSDAMQSCFQLIDLLV